MSGKKIRTHRIELFHQQNGICYWCRKQMVMPEKYPEDGILGPDFCTLDHLFDRTHRWRTKATPGIKRWVAACLECNQERGRISDRRSQARAA